MGSGEKGRLTRVDFLLEGIFPYLICSFSSLRSWSCSSKGRKGVYGQQFQIRKLYGAKALLSKGLTFLDKTSDR